MEALCCKKPKKSAKLIVYDAKSIYLLDHQTSLRKTLVKVANHTLFENFIILCIIVNSIVLIAYDHRDLENLTKHNQNLEQM